jgi:hypothetical protein
VLALQALGLGQAEIDLADLDLEPDWYRLLDEEERDQRAGLLHGIEVGIPAGALVGIGLMAFAIPGVGTVAVSTAADGAAVGAFWGSFLGAWAGLMRRSHWKRMRNAGSRCRSRAGKCSSWAGPVSTMTRSMACWPRTAPAASSIPPSPSIRSAPRCRRDDRSALRC